MNKPNLFVVGAAKAGTTSLFHYLSQHPEIYAPPIKEPNHFGTDIDLAHFRKDYLNRNHIIGKSYFKCEKLEKRHIAYIKDLNNYLKLYRDAKKEKYLIDVSNSYLYSNLAAKEIYDFNKSAKIIIILRQPVERAISHYIMDVAQNRQKELDAYKAIKSDYEAKLKGWGISNLYVELSQFSNQAKRYLDIFPKDQIVIVSFDELKNNPIQLMNKLWSFLNIDPIQLETNKIFNPSGVPKNLFLKSLIKIYKRYFKYLKLSAPKLKSILLKKPEFNNYTSAKAFLEEILKVEIEWYKNI